MGTQKIKRFKDIPIYLKIILIVVGTSLILIAGSLLFQEKALKQSFITLEGNNSIKDHERTKNILDRELVYLDQLLTDWCLWDDTYEFTSDRNEEYIHSNLQNDTFYSIAVDLFYIFNLKEELVWGEVFDLDNEEKITSNTFTEKYIKSDSIFFTQEELKTVSPDELVHHGFWKTDMGLFIIAARPILKSDETGPPAGVLIMGRLLSDTVLKNIESLTQNNLGIYTDKNNELLNRLKESGDSTHIRRLNESIIVSSLLKDITGSDEFLLETVTDRSIAKFGDRSIEQFRTMTLFFIILITIFLIILFEIVITKPIKKITIHLDKIKMSGNMNLTLNDNRNDEIGMLSSGIDNFVYELMNLNGKLKEQASTDALTGLLNRHILDTEIPILWKTLSRTRTQISAILIDIDYFKKYNDTYGHQEGDSCLRKVSEIIVKSLKRTTDKVIRFGGEEFLIILPTTDKEGCLLVAEKVRSNINETGIKHRSSEVAEHVTISIGVSTMVPDFENDLDQLIKEADMALYESKKNGRNRITFHKE